MDSVLGQLLCFALVGFWALFVGPRIAITAGLVTAAIGAYWLVSGGAGSLYFLGSLAVRYLGLMMMIFGILLVGFAIEQMDRRFPSRPRESGIS